MDKFYDTQDEALDEFDDVEELNELEDWDTSSSGDDEDIEDISEGEDFSEDGSGSRRKKKISHRGRKREKRRKWPFVLIIFAALVLFLAAGFKLTTVEVTGSEIYTSEEIKTMISFPENLNHTLVCYLKYVRYHAQDIPFIQSITVKLTGMHGIKIIVEEKSVVGCIKSGNTYIYFDKKGMVQEITDTAVGNLPLAEGIAVDELEIGARIKAKNDEVQRGIVETAEFLKTYQIKVDKILVTDSGDIMLDAGEGITVNLGKPVFISDKILELANILPSVRDMQSNEGITGTLHLENYDSSQNSIYFSKEK